MRPRRFLAACALLLALAGCATTESGSGPVRLRAGGGAPPLDLTGVPAAPAGYRTEEAIRLAYAFGRIRLLTDAAPVELPPGVREELDVVYASPEGRDLRMDIYVPAGSPPEGAPGIVFVHGGSWKGGTRKDVRFYAVRYAARGYVTATVDYRLSSVATFPAPLEDVRAAIRFLRGNASAYGLRPDALAVVGHSAGGHLALLAAYARDADAGRDAVRAVVDFYGPVDLTEGVAASHPAVRALMGKSLEEARAAYEDASPLRLVRPGLPPTLIFHGTIDSTVPVAQSDALFTALDAAGVPAYEDRVRGWPHAMDVEARVNQHCAGVMDAFLDHYLRG
jgi:acetyl esterase/lipase